MSQAKFQKRMREKAKQEKQAAKRERKAERAETAESADESTDPDAPPEATVLEQLAALHERFADDAIDFEEFEERKQELLAQLDV
ncbi:MAG: hypothetical protein ACLGHQ_04930 [Acidimicrobiia bacterium]